MNLNDFFETNSTALEAIELFEDYCEEKSTKKAALNATRTTLCMEYLEEKDQSIIVLMSVYWCGLKSNIVDEKSKNELETLTRDDVIDVFGEDDGKTIYETLELLLKTEPIKPQRKKIDYSNPGSKNWNVGDVYAYPLRGEEYAKVGIEGKYLVIHCLEKEIVSSRKAEIVFYMILCDAENIENPLEELLDDGIYLKSDYKYGYYRFRLISSHHEYPTDTIIYLGNTSARFCTSDEILAPNSFFQTMVVWQYIESQVLSSYRCELKYKNASPTVETKKPDPQKIAEQELQKIQLMIENQKK